MTRLTIPISHKMIWATGDVRLFADIELLLKDGSGNWGPELFRVDTASDLTTFPAHDAKKPTNPLACPTRPNRP